MAFNASYRRDGTDEIRLEITCGWVQGFSTTGRWTATSKYVVDVGAEEKFQVVIDDLKSQAGPQSKADKIYGVDKNGKKHKLDPNATVRQNTQFSDGTTLELRFPNLLG
mmetsp:Transcript_26879/g.29974  ORF Transcript_26879/g.29974 Transcript_26879/m.29974 type:complete len:109 (+) Transcript_26879:214-540(+)|eukprot:CAMPEP_0168510288 /NCGR_PEP_ID=MMETSP0405-20121227/1361_1 /TAXON_ID=498012 /ORGANISM="Trichosphaerium sp, Strain Am-I-7 wt" /LENGTH=108 /DNA_ID=CAMNT_0008528067 /DNA_START=1546 /DNA_END=1872 /DNA_ORIENTATION=+